MTAWLAARLTSRRLLPPRLQALTSLPQRVRQSSLARPSNIATLLKPGPASSDGDSVTVCGFVQSVRRQKRVAFAAIGDGSSLEALQAVLSPEQAAGLSTGTSIEITGKWQPSPPGKEQTHELHGETVRVLGASDAAKYPLQKKFHTPEYLRTIPHLRCRTPFNALLLRLRSHMIAQLTSYFAREDFVQTHPPVITSSDCEGAGEVFTMYPSQHVKSGLPADDPSELFFRSPKYLTVSSQLHLEAFAQSVGKVWTLSPTFRAEKSDTARHLSEFYMLEAEMCFISDLSQVMDLVEGTLRNLAVYLQSSQVGKELIHARSTGQHDEEEANISADDLQRRWQKLAEGPWPRITYREAISRLEEAASQGLVSFEFAPSMATGLQAEHERFLAEDVGQCGPVFVTDYPQDLKPFYMAPSDSPGQPVTATPTVACFDLLVPELCEIAGGSMREHRLPQLLEAMARNGMAIPSVSSDREPASATSPSRTAQDTESPDSAKGPDNLWWYLDLRRYGTVPHGGFGLGFDRLLGYLSGVSNVRDVVGFPRWYGRSDC